MATLKRQILNSLKRASLDRIARATDVKVPRGTRIDMLRTMLSRKRRLSQERLIEMLAMDELRTACRKLEL